MNYELKQGQITPNIDYKYILKLIHLVAQCSKIINTVLFLKLILHHFSAFRCFLLVMLECPKVHFVALRFIYISIPQLYYIKGYKGVYISWTCYPDTFTSLSYHGYQIRTRT